MQKNNFNVFIPLLFAVVLAIGMQLGFKMYESIKGKSSKTASSFLSSGRGNSEFDEILNYVQAKYVDTVNVEQFTDRAFNRALHELDPHSSYISPSELQDVEESLQGNFDGIGVEFSIVKDTLVVITPIAGGPSEALGIRAGDKIVKINDSTAVKLDNEQIVKKLRGIRGTKVKVSIYRKGVPELLDFTITRDKIPLVSVDAGYMMDNQVGYIKVNRFSATTYEEFMTKLAALKESGMTKLILDLRQNPGGFLNAAVDIADEFLPGQSLIVYTEGRTYKRKDYKAGRDGLFEQGDLVVLVDEGSASASEIVSGAVQDWDRGEIIGRRSFGKGLVQEQYDLSNGGALRLTVARYHTPSGRCIQKSYEDGIDAYEEDLEHRYEDGELENPDSVSAKQKIDSSQVFKTKIKGRKVYGGGGISPDISVPLEKLSSAFVARARGVVPQFVYNYYSNHQPEFKQYATVDAFAKNFTISNAMFDEYEKTVKTELKILDEKQLNANRGLIETTMKAYFARQLWGNDGFYPIINKEDKTLQKAYQTILN